MGSSLGKKESSYVKWGQVEWNEVKVILNELGKHVGNYQRGQNELIEIKVFNRDKRRVDKKDQQWYV
jgi:hypothetical protein